MHSGPINFAEDFSANGDAGSYNELRWAKFARRNYEGTIKYNGGNHRAGQARSG